MERNYRFSIGDVVFSEFDFGGLRAFFPVKILDYAGVDCQGKNYLVVDQNGEEFSMFEDNLSMGSELQEMTNELVFNEEDEEED